MLNDSGDRREFDTGAVRDMHEGKGRCDLLPLGVVSNLCRGPHTSGDEILACIDAFQDGSDPVWLETALSHFCKVAFGGSMPSMLLELAIHFEEGGKKYGEYNWQKGIPVWCYIDSAVRHYLKYLRSDTDERHDRAFVWNLVCCIWTVEHEKGEIWR